MFAEALILAKISTSRPKVSVSKPKSSTSHVSTTKPKTTAGTAPKKVTTNQYLYHGITYWPVVHYLNTSNQTIYYTLCYDKNHHQVKCDKKG